MAIKQLHLSSLLLAIAALMLGSVIAAPLVYQAHTMCGTTLPPNQVTITSNNLPIIIRSINYGRGQFAGEVYCTFLLDTGKEPRVVLLEFKKFEMEYSHACTSDFLCIHGVNFCGNWAEGKEFRYVIPRYERSTIVFHADNTRDYAGIEAEKLLQTFLRFDKLKGGSRAIRIIGEGADSQSAKLKRHKRSLLTFLCPDDGVVESFPTPIIVSARQASDNEIVLEPVGMGTSEQNVSYVNVTYNSLMHYEDKCYLQPYRTKTSEAPMTISEPLTSAIEPQLDAPQLDAPQLDAPQLDAPQLDAPQNIAVRPISATKHTNKMNCTCKCRLPTKQHNYYTKPSVAKDNGF